MARCCDDSLLYGMEDERKETTIDEKKIEWAQRGAAEKRRKLYFLVATCVLPGAWNRDLCP